MSKLFTKLIIFFIIFIIFTSDGDEHGGEFKSLLYPITSPACTSECGMVLARTCVEGGGGGGGGVGWSWRSPGKQVWWLRGSGGYRCHIAGAGVASDYPVSARLWIYSSMVAAGSLTSWGNCGVEVEVGEVEQKPHG